MAVTKTSAKSQTERRCHRVRVRPFAGLPGLSSPRLAGERAESASTALRGRAPGETPDRPHRVRHPPPDRRLGSGGCAPTPFWTYLRRRDKPPLRISIVPAGPKVFAVMVEPVNSHAEDRIRTLEEQLKSTEEFLRTTIEEYEAATEELKCSYEELRAANEELQITTEELRDSHASVAATRDRLEAINRNLQVQHSRLQRRFDEFVGLIHSLGLPIILLSNDLRLRFFNRAAERIFHLTAADEGLHFRTLESTLDLDTLTDTCAAVLDQLQPADRTIGNFSFHIRPLLTPENRIEGVIIRGLP